MDAHDRRVRSSLEAGYAVKLEAAIAQWRRRLSIHRSLPDEDLDELESHVRDQIDELLSSGFTLEAAFQKATAPFSDGIAVTDDLKSLSTRGLGSTVTLATDRLRHHVKLAIRSGWRHGFVSGMTVLGLSMGLACALILGLLIAEELSYDQFHEDADLIHRVVVDRLESDRTRSRRIETPDALADALVREISEVRASTRLVPPGSGKVVLRGGQTSLFTDSYLEVDTTFFDLFTFCFREGGPETSLLTPNSIVLTAKLATKFFGQRPAIGEILTIDGSRDVTVDGVVCDVPQQSHLTFEFLVRNLRPTSWGGTRSYTYFKLDEKASIDSVEAKITRLVGLRTDTVGLAFYTQPLAGTKGIHLASHRIHELRPNSDWGRVKTLIYIAILVLIVAGVNYVNLATAQATTRKTEIGVLQVVGARRTTLIGQFLAEALVASMVASILALTLVSIGLPYLEQITGRNFSFLESGSSGVLWILPLACVGVGLLVGFYPAIALSRQRPSEMFGVGDLRTLRPARVRSGLVVVQFAIAVTLVCWSFRDTAASRVRHVIQPWF